MEEPKRGFESRSQMDIWIFVFIFLLINQSDQPVSGLLKIESAIFRGLGGAERPQITIIILGHGCFGRSPNAIKFFFRNKIWLRKRSECSKRLRYIDDATGKYWDNHFQEGKVRDNHLESARTSKTAIDEKHVKQIKKYLLGNHQLTIKPLTAGWRFN